MVHHAQGELLYGDEPLKSSANESLFPGRTGTAWSKLQLGVTAENPVFHCVGRLMEAEKRKQKFPGLPTRRFEHGGTTCRPGEAARVVGS
eukprot:CAMPEP_0202839154 /NCGR_PEP_ID=MMETSP1389-20130828/51645_1 /ASSEMBLY_ACC=CAM_ASM_000865 /TAXON_ID=302021 /ORGANISM="Rhodomonas sp., Strain CCMP768" /LENGTH=89 /DNA_ID=CAMNT_0049515565 /DNA_START=75 /DNA_END=340 /DNA_ORIENTATION=-